MRRSGTCCMSRVRGPGTRCWWRAAGLGRNFSTICEGDPNAAGFGLTTITPPFAPYCGQPRPRKKGAAKAPGIWHYCAMADAGGMEMPDVLGYLDYRVYLKDWYDARKRREKGFSYRVLASEVGYRSHSFFSLVLRRKSNISMEMAMGFA